MAKNHLALAPEKTEAMTLAWGRRAKPVTFQMNGVPIQPAREAKYLGIMLDRQMTFGSHVRYATAKADRTITALNRLMPNIRGPRACKRKLLCSVGLSILLYGAPVWYSAVRIQRYRQMLTRTQRKMTLRICSAYRTVSSEAAQVLAGVPPIELLIEERREIAVDESDSTLEEKKARARERTLEKWQALWDTAENGAWTRRLIPHLHPWLGRKHGEVSYYVTQALTAHGSFRAYTKRIGKTQDNCIHCQMLDHAEHTLFHCPRWADMRRQMETQCGGRHLDPDNIVAEMLESEASWEHIEEGITRILKCKEIEERERELENNPNP